MHACVFVFTYHLLCVCVCACACACVHIYVNVSVIFICDVLCIVYICTAMYVTTDIQSMNARTYCTHVYTQSFMQYEYTHVNTRTLVYTYAHTSTHTLCRRPHRKNTRTNYMEWLHVLSTGSYILACSPNSCVLSECSLE